MSVNEGKVNRNVLTSLTPSDENVNQSSDVRPVEGFHDQHVEVESFDEHPEKRRDVKVVKQER